MDRTLLPGINPVLPAPLDHFAKLPLHLPSLVLPVLIVVVNKLNAQFVLLDTIATSLTLLQSLVQWVITAPEELRIVLFAVQDICVVQGTTLIQLLLPPCVLLVAIAIPHIRTRCVPQEPMV